MLNRAINRVYGDVAGGIGDAYNKVQRNPFGSAAIIGAGGLGAYSLGSDLYESGMPVAREAIVEAAQRRDQAERIDAIEDLRERRAKFNHDQLLERMREEAMRQALFQNTYLR